MARNAAGVKVIRTWTSVPASACMSLVSCLPGLEDVNLSMSQAVMANDLGCLLEALAWCPRLRALDLSIYRGEEDMLPVVPALAKLRSLTKLALSFGRVDSPLLDSVARALVSLPGLAVLKLANPGFARKAAGVPEAAIVPTALRQLKGLRSLEFAGLHQCALQAGCLDLPNPSSLVFRQLQLQGCRGAPGHHRSLQPHMHGVCGRPGTTLLRS